MFLFVIVHDNLKKSIVRIHVKIIILGLLVLISHGVLIRLLEFREFVCFVRTFFIGLRGEGGWVIVGSLRIFSIILPSSNVCSIGIILESISSVSLTIRKPEKKLIFA